MGTELHWGTKSATDTVRLVGRKVGDMRTPAGGNYSVYKYDGFLVQIHNDDEEIILVMKGENIIHVHPRDEERMRKLITTTTQQKPTRRGKHK